MAFEAITVKEYWDANANRPFLLAGRGRNGDAYLVTVAGSAVLGQVGNWQVGDLAVFVLDRWVRLPAALDPSLYALVAGTLAQFAATTSAQLAGVISDETGSAGGGLLVFNKAPTLIDPDVGTQTPGNNTGKGASTAFVGAAITAAFAALVAFKAVRFQPLIVSGVNYVPDANLITAALFTLGGGAGSGGVASAAGTLGIGGGGGGAGSWSIKFASAASIGVGQLVTIGAAGAAGTSGGGNGGAGGDTSIGALCVGKGGTGGSGGSGGPASGGAGGVAGTGDITSVGMPGGAASVYTNSFGLSGAGGSSPLGGGGQSIASSTNAAGAAGTGRGSGGSGAASYNAGGAAAGAVGTLGYAFALEFCKA